MVVPRVCGAKGWRWLFVMVALLAGCALPGSWRTFSAPDGSFSVQMPGPVEREDVSASLSGGAVVVPSYSARQGTTVFTVTYLDYRKTVQADVHPQDRLRAARDKVLESLQGQVFSDDTVEVQGYQGRDFSFVSASQEITVRHRLILVDQKLYQLMVVAEQGKLPEAAAQTFMDSFKLKGK